MSADDGDLDPRLAHFADELSSLAIDPSPESRRRILAAVHDARIAVSRPPESIAARIWGNRPLRLSGIALAMCLATIGTGAGALAASAEALPGSPGHGLRLAGENLSLALAPTSEKARLHERFVRDRLAQAVEAKRRGEKSVASELLGESRRYLEDFNHEIGQLPTSERSAAEGQLHQLEADSRESDRQGPATDSPPARVSPDAVPGSNPGGEPVQPGGAVEPPDGSSRPQPAPGSSDGSAEPTAAAGQ